MIKKVMTLVKVEDENSTRYIAKTSIDVVKNCVPKGTKVTEVKATVTININSLLNKELEEITIRERGE